MNYNTSRWNKQPESTTAVMSNPVASQPTQPRQPRSQASTGVFSTNQHVEYAGFWLRLWAHILDGFLIVLAVGIPMMFDATFRDFVINNSVVANLVIGLFTWLYFAGMECSASQGTIGKMAFGIKVTDGNGAQISFLRASGRYFGKILSAMTLNVGYLMAAFTNRKQALHDLVSGCLVVRELR